MTNETQRLQAKITLGEFLERVTKSKHPNNAKDKKNFLELYTIFGQMEQDILDLNQHLGQSELNNSIMGAKIKELERKNKDLIKKL